MRYLSILCVLLLAACQSEENRVPKMVTSPDGHDFAFMAITEEGVRDITIKVAWDTNWLQVPENNPFVPMIGTSMLLNGGTADLPTQEIGELFADRGVDAEVVARIDHVVGEIEISNRYIEELLPIPAEILATPIYEQRWLDRGIAQLRDQANQVADQSALQMWSAARLAILGETNVLRQANLSPVDQIEAVTLGDVERWHKETFTKRPAAIAVTGGATQKQAGELVDLLLAELPDTQTEPFGNYDVTYTPGRYLLHRPDAEKTVFGMIRPLPPLSANTDIEEDLAIRVFGKPVEGPLFQLVRSDLRASYGFSAGASSWDRENRFLIVTGEVETVKTDEVSEAVLSAFLSFGEDPDLEGFAALRDDLADGIDDYLEGVDRNARILVEGLLDGRELSAMTNLGDSYRNTLAREVRDHVQSNFPDVDELMIFVSSPDPNALTDACVFTAIEDIHGCIDQ